MSDAEHILQHLDKAYILIEKDKSYKIIQSAAVLHILGDIKDKQSPIAELLGLPEAKSVMFEPSLDQFFDHFMPADVSLNLLPHRLNLSGRIISIRYTPIYEKGLPDPEQLLMELSDITAEETQQRLQEIQNQQNEILLKILKDKETFLTFLKDAEGLLDTLTKNPDQSVGLRILHTLKGNSSAFGLNDIATRIHELENESEDQIHIEGVETYFLNAAYEISSLFDSFLVDHFSILGVSRQSNDATSFQISEQELLEIERQLIAIEDPNIKQSIGKHLQKFRTKPVSIFTSTFPSTVSRLAKTLEKDIDFQIQGENLKICPDTVGHVLREMIHVIRNCCDHGLEHPDERQKNGKTSHGSILLTIKETKDNMIEILVEDDGRGINIEKLVKISIEKGVITKEQAHSMSEQDKLDLLFQDGVSTAESVSQVSGRGVGMAALKQQVVATQGSLHISTTPGKGSQFQITLPKFLENSQRQDMIQPTIIQWNPSLNIGIEDMDQQHRKLVRYLADLQTLEHQWLNGEGIQVKTVDKVLTQLIEYTHFHFKAEEDMLQRNHYPDFDAHQKLHKKLLAQVESIVDDFRKDGLKVLPRITSFIENWLKGHILGTDRQYSHFLHQGHIEWTAGLAIGVAPMDDQHQVLINYINEFKSLSQQAKDGQLTNFRPIENSIQKLLDYTAYHFKEEEELLMRQKYPDFEDHKKLHERLIQQVVTFQEKFQHDPIRIIPKLSSFLSRWLLQHIQGHDKQYGVYIQHKKKEAA